MLTLPSNYMHGKTWSWDWDVPGFATAVSSVIVAVSDSTGTVSGTSALSKLTKAGSCSAPPEHLDFVWFPPSSSPKQCNDWLLTVQEDRGNLGLKMPVDLLILPENDAPTRLRITDAKKSSVDWTVNYARGTNFAIAAFDAGTSGTGGVGGQTYTVERGKSTSCIEASQREAVAGLPAASSTAAPLSAATSTAAASRMATSRVAATATKTNAKTSATSTTADNVAATQEKSGPSGGVIGGAVGGVLAALAIAGLVIFLYRKQRSNKGPDEYGVYPNNEKRSFFGGFGSGRSTNRDGFSGRGARDGGFGASTDRQGGISPFVTGRASPWRWSSRQPVGLSDHQDMAQIQDERRAIANRMNSEPRSMGHSSSVSLHRSGDSINASGGVGLNLAPSVHSVVPDDALFPPPMPVHRNMILSNSGSMGNVGAGLGAGAAGAIGTKRHWNRDRSDSDSTIPIQPSSQYGVEHQDLSTMRIPPPAPVTTSLFDPYAHASRLYSDQEIAHLNAALAKGHNDRAHATTPTSVHSHNSAPRYADPKESAARFRTLDDQLRNDRKKVVSSVFAHEDDSDDEGGLPYM
ncbi:hypothetical protein PHBOTO_000306 [Pseudozyma hubeiensis]|nr:hypothetical protein PHBOTO_000306 [Pseudozyma hubeiensis]